MISLKMPSAYPMITDPDRLNFSTELRKPTDQLSKTRRKRKEGLENGGCPIERHWGAAGP